MATLPLRVDSRPELVSHHLTEAEEFRLAGEFWRRSGTAVPTAWPVCDPPRRESTATTGRSEWANVHP